ncbi:hypothetical protein [Actinomadura opuntiae]|uniref:hypothetical protein n=1 Tax=Actinomadura sp. OS1-43 TaxID=604315 RepID=UPI00255A9616|nr:hypothetical protein [Actinomadura sp. OS1-43]MDL4818629.1 hypothetical protein [Actinomadura sp. OS1-43]
MTDTMADLPPIARRIPALLPGWGTVRTKRRVLIVIHSVTSATRLSDVLPAFHDPNLHLFCTQTSDAMFSNGVASYMSARGLLCLTWEQAASVKFDLVVTASLGDNLHELTSPILRLAHGNGYNKRWNQEPRTKNQEPRTKNQEPRTKRSSDCPPGP